ncbi:MAG: hypothetical protein ABWZ42_04250 [Ilumatobacteraceae bacterium]
MDDLHDILKSAAASPRHTIDATVLESRIRSRRRRRGIVRVTAVVTLVVIGVAALGVANAGDHSNNLVPAVTTELPPASTSPATTLPATTTSLPVAESTVPTTSPIPAVGASMTVTVLDGIGQPFPAATSGVRACRVVSGAADCATPIESIDDDGDGVVRIVLPVDSQYAVNAFAYDTNWPCPSAESDGTPFHHSDAQDVPAGGSIDGATFAIVRPNPGECPSDLPSAVINLLDDAGRSLTDSQAFVDVCGYDPLFPPKYPTTQQHLGCSPDSGFVHPDSEGVIRVHVNPALTYDISSLAHCDDGSFLNGDSNRTPDGYPVWTMTAGELLATGELTLTIHGDVDACLGS